ncbi:MAG: TIGR02206 family membrane protein [Myxococcota bacterium]|nr:TIGR02206 family membrane protein [Myxococcota bacterium]
MRENFELFNTQHGIILGLCVLATILPILLAKRFVPKHEFKLRLLLSTLIFGQEIHMWCYRLLDGSYDVLKHLPLHMCGLSICLMPLMLYTQNKKLFAVLYFWGMGGATQALLTPTVNSTTEAFYFYQFFYAHGLIVVCVLYAAFQFRLQLYFSDLLRAVATSLAILPVIGLINWLLGSNYFYLAGKPDGKTILDFMGPWPWYIIPLVGLGFVIFLIVYIPFPISRKLFSQPQTNT